MITFTWKHTSRCSAPYSRLLLITLVPASPSSRAFPFFARQTHQVLWFPRMHHALCNLHSKPPQSGTFFSLSFLPLPTPWFPSLHSPPKSCGLGTVSHSLHVPCSHDGARTQLLASRCLNTWLREAETGFLHCNIQHEQTFRCCCQLSRWTKLKASPHNTLRFLKVASWSNTE